MLSLLPQWKKFGKRVLRNGTVSKKGTSVKLLATYYKLFDPFCWRAQRGIGTGIGVGGVWVL